MARADPWTEPVHFDHRGGHVPDSRPTVFVVDDDASMRESLRLLIESAGWRPETFASGPEFLACSRAMTPSCLVLDVVLPELSGSDLQALVADRPEMPIIFISGHGDVPVAVRAMKAGAADFFTKPFVADVLLAAIGNAIERSRAALADADGMRSLRDRYESLSRREREVMALVVTGRLNKQVGSSLGISEVTVKAHRGQMMRKMQADSLPDLVGMATRLRHR
jgi:FixJ family two-component response regulator